MEYELVEEKKQRRSAFVRELKRLASTDNLQRTDRQALAELRGCLRGTPADHLRASRYVAPHLGERASSDDTFFYLLAGLFAFHPDDKKGVSFGQAFGALRETSGSMDARFLALLNTRTDALPATLRRVHALLKSKGIGLDYLRLLEDLCLWSHPESYVQKQWARDYFRSGAVADVPAATDDVTNESENAE
jgi:CRISPR system Cascade subunit CasB